MAGCRACHHPDHDRVDRETVSGVPFRRIHAWSGLSLGTLSRHKTHIKELLTKAALARDVESAEHGSDLVNRVQELLGEAHEILTTAKSEKNLTAAVAAINACSRLLELCGRATGELQTSGGGIHFHATKNVTNISVRDGDDVELALLVKEATAGFSPDEINRLRTLTETASLCHERDTHSLSD